jgi:hypothetical protein
LRDLLAWMESSTLGHLMRESGPWTYPVVNLAHLLGVAILFGSLLLLDLRLIGLWRRVPLSALADIADPVATFAFGLAVVSGVALLATNATEYIGNPFLLVKFPAIAVGFVNVMVLKRTAAWRARRERALSGPESRQLALMGGISLLSWLTAVSAGRLVGYW